MNAPTDPALLRAAASSALADHPAAVARLCAALDATFEACRTPDDPSRCTAFAQGVRAALGLALADPALVTPAQREGCATRYRRYLLAACPAGRYAVAALVWLPGQASPIHAHHTWCGYAVLEGTLTETLYRWDAERDGATVLRAHARNAGTVAFGGRGRAGIHRLSRAIDEMAGPCISLHVYGVAAEHIATGVNDIVPLVGLATPFAG
ncbi:MULTISPECIES: cysteine dioxygenase family protein [unclassified Paraburkholderia]|uniref:cysteine dioxygenase family protein n=1 Tax=unclassified Paraburkholderia TaxID=2615204 RepID=UPI002AB045EB|nr:MULTISPECIES: cysteine dioxygenase family protein [unclassified Paraburkholderia]